MGILNEANRWFNLASCKDLPDGVDYWYSPEPGDPDYRPSGAFPSTRSSRAKMACNDCRVRVQCLSYAMAWEAREQSKVGPSQFERHGIWGGLKPEQREKLAKELAKLSTPAERAERIREIATTDIHIPRIRTIFPDTEAS